MAESFPTCQSRYREPCVKVYQTDSVLLRHNVLNETNNYKEHSK